MVLRGTRRTKQDATRSAVAWVWSWWNQLSEHDKGRLRQSAEDPEEPLPKRRRQD